jgi:hypothetical protein
MMTQLEQHSDEPAASASVHISDGTDSNHTQEASSSVGSDGPYMGSDAELVYVMLSLKQQFERRMAALLQRSLAELGELVDAREQENGRATAEEELRTTYAAAQLAAAQTHDARKKRKRRATEALGGNVVDDQVPPPQRVAITAVNMSVAHEQQQLQHRPQQQQQQQQQQQPQQQRERARQVGISNFRSLQHDLMEAYGHQLAPGWRIHVYGRKATGETLTTFTSPSGQHCNSMEVSARPVMFV